MTASARATRTKHAGTRPDALYSSVVAMRHPALVAFGYSGSRLRTRTTVTEAHRAAKHADAKGTRPPTPCRVGTPGLSACWCRVGDRRTSASHRAASAQPRPLRVRERAAQHRWRGVRSAGSLVPRARHMSSAPHTLAHSRVTYESLTSRRARSDRAAIARRSRGHHS